MNSAKCDNTSSSENIYKILSLFEEEKVLGQRVISGHSDYDSVKFNYLVNSLMQKEFVKLENFLRKENYAGYYYMLTSFGIEKKYSDTKEILM